MLLAQVGFLVALSGSGSPKRQLDHIAALGKSGKLTAIPELYRVVTGTKPELQVPAAKAIQRICRTTIGAEPNPDQTNGNPFVSGIERSKISVNLQRFLDIQPELIVAYENAGRYRDAQYKRHLIEYIASKRFGKDYEDKSEEWPFFICGGVIGDDEMTFVKLCRDSQGDVQNLLLSPSFAYKGGLISAMGRCPAALESTLIELSRSKPSSVRVAAIFAFPNDGNEEIIDALVAAVKDERAAVRRAVAWKARQVAPKQAKEILSTLAQDPNKWIREEAKRELTDTGFRPSLQFGKTKD